MRRSSRRGWGEGADGSESRPYLLMAVIHMTSQAPPRVSVRLREERQR
jgi:hypothetical protein